MDRQVREGRELEGFEPVSVKIRKPADAVFSIRLTQEDFALLRRHTQAKGLNMSEFAREALLRAIEDDAEEPLAALVAGAQRMAKLARRVDVSGSHRKKGAK
jgi:post-segregation antitoxin (ccd killing protein)